MKATMGMNYRALSSELQQISNRLFDLRQQAATGKKFNKPSDNPGAIRPLLHYRIQNETAERYLNHMSVAQGEIQLLDSGLDHIEDIMVRAKELGIAALNGSTNEEDRKTYANQIGMLFDELLQASNSQANGQYIFAGYEDKTVPFEENAAYNPDDYDPDDSSTWPVIYHGDNNVKSVEIAYGKSIQIALTGNELFLGDIQNDQSVDSGNTNLFAVLKNFENAIRENDLTKMNEGLENLENGAEQVHRLRGKMGNNALRIEKTTEQLNDASIEFRQIISRYEDADILDVYSQLVQQETAFEAALNVTSRVSKLSILDFM
ncbi:MAG: flagellar hook-associated protein FlgL [Desulfobacterales bacterium]|nr:flagellar hook-associated protein FlgL [Desulfobacterales bacterium]